jgi:upstream activation factor subunit UAF30
MPRQSKSKTEVAETTPAVNTPVVSTSANEQVLEKAPKTKKESKPKAPKDESAAPAPVVTAPVETAPVETAEGEFRSLEKKWSREIKTAQKSQAKRKRKSGNRQPSGFVKPTKISDELAKFLEKPVGTEMARTDVTREINTYIRAHKLQDKDNGRKINPDAKLAALLKLKKTDELTYFNLQRYMSPHFSKAEKAATAA